MKALQFSVTVPQFVALKALGTLSKKLYYSGPVSTINLVEIPKPSLPSANWVKIKTCMIGFCGSDLNLIFLRDSPSASPFTSFPCVLGHEMCGEVVAVGSQVEKVKKGDLVTIAPALNCSAREIEQPCRPCREGRFGNCENFAEGTLSPGMFTGICSDVGGGFAEYFVAHESQVFALPPEVGLEEGAMIEPLSVAIQAVMDNYPADQDSVLIIGGGVIGNLILQTIKAFNANCNVTVSEPSAFHAEMAEKKGADHVIRDGNLLTRTTSLTQAKEYKPMMGDAILMGGYNKIFDAVGNSKTLNDSLRTLAFGGTLSVVGIGHDVKLDLTPLWLKYQTIKGVFACGFNTINGVNKHAFETAIELVQSKKVDLKNMVTHKFKLEQYKDLIELNLAKSKNKAIKTMVEFS
ncbi:alcohol dehydrogenase catalytic domain-containing protein [bacterium]|nr:alcohol dehydrogenase catalytic domain-containing protein [bacterium]